MLLVIVMTDTKDKGNDTYFNDELTSEFVEVKELENVTDAIEMDKQVNTRKYKNPVIPNYNEFI